MPITYEAQVNSPITKLKADITAEETQIELVDTGKLLPAPNLFTIIDGENSETILYTEVVGAVYTCQRGFQGTAKAWTAGKKVARLMTAYDYNVIRPIDPDLIEVTYDLNGRVDVVTCTSGGTVVRTVTFMYEGNLLSGLMEESPQGNSTKTITRTGGKITSISRG